MRTDMGTDVVTNLTVHGVGPTVRELDPGEDRTWVDIARLECVLDAAAGRTGVQITVDDGNGSDVDVVLPRLLERGLKAEFFLLAGRIGEVGRVDRSGVQELVAAGMAIGSHGWAHRDWRRLRRAGVSRVYTSDGGPARVDAWLQARTSLRSDIGPDWTQRLTADRVTPTLRARRFAARSVKRWRGPGGLR